MTREDMISVAKQSMAYQDNGQIDEQMALYAQDCTFLMPHLTQPLRGAAELRRSVEMWPQATTEAETFVAEGDRLVMVWVWRGKGCPEGVRPVRGVSVFDFDDDGLIRHYEDFFDVRLAESHVPSHVPVVPVAAA